MNYNIILKDYINNSSDIINFLNDKLLDVNGKQITISKIEYKKYDSPIDTYNLTIEGNNNYFVTDIQVLVHNAPSPNL